MTDSAEGAAATRNPSQLDALAEDYLDAYADLNPIMATFIGLSGYDDRMPDLSPAGLDAVGS